MNAPKSSFPDLAIPAEFRTRFDAQGQTPDKSKRRLRRTSS